MKPFAKKFFQSLFLHPRKNGRRDSSWLERIKTPSYQKWLVAIVTALILGILLSPSFQLRIREYDIGDVAMKEVRSSHDLLVEDKRSTQEKRLEAEKAILSVYDYDPGVLTTIEQRLRSLANTSPPPASNLEKETGQEVQVRDEWESSLRSILTPKEWRVLERARSMPSFAEGILRLLAPILRRGVVSTKDLVDPDADKGLIIRNIQTREERRVLPPTTVLDLKTAKDRIRAQGDVLQATLGKDIAPVAVKVAEQLVRPSLTINKDETEERKSTARAKVSPVYFQVKRGEIILRAGDRVQADHLLKIQALREARKRGHVLSIVIGLILLAFLTLSVLYQFSARNIRKFVLSQKDLLFVSTTLLGTIGFFKLFQLITEILGGEFLSIPSSSYQYLFPIATGAMLVRIVINSEVAIVYAILTSYFASALVGNQLFFFVFAMVGSILGAHKVAQCEQRNIIIKAGLTVGGINVLMIFSQTLISGNPFQMVFISDLIMGFFAGALASVLLLGLTPIIESLFGYTTDIKLLELANIDNPIIKDLILQAPGTYHHSVIVGSLGEAAARSVSANPLLVRVSAYYHDIGKLKKPLYFIENAGGMESKHDNLTPKMSSLVLLSHVKDGIELARESRLGPRISHIIQQHHGTSLTSYFYKKAKDQENPEMDPQKEEDFRYPGPKPQTKEAGIVMLADEVEAASRTLTDPTPSRIRSLVQRIINNVFLDGQLEECELTLKDLHKIEESFTRILTGIFHQRVDYPLLPVPASLKKRNDEDLDSKSAKTYAFRPKKNKKDGQDDLGGIGTS
jgi:putative nucleotidyltransferase with HDIG domain